MKIAILGDTHKNEYGLSLALNKINELKADMVIHLGDCVDDIETIKSSFNGNVLGVAGNCDCTSKFPSNQLININTKKIFFTHGHLYGVKNSINSILYKGEELGADIILFGHTHLSILDEFNHIILMNPGSIPKPSPLCKSGCIGFIDISDDGEIISKQLYPISFKLS